MIILPTRCSWVGPDPLHIVYHDREWGVPVHDDRTLFEFLVLSGFQAGLSWLTILKRREHYRQVFDQFEPAIMAGYGTEKITCLLNDPGIIRNRRKVEAAVTNARAVMALGAAGSFTDLLWDLAGGKPRVNQWREASEIPAATPESEAMSKELVRHGFRFVGPTICYAFMQSVGMVNDHLVSCFRYHEVDLKV